MAGLLLLVLITAASGTVLFRRSLRPEVLVAAVAASQVVLHPVFQGMAGGHDGHAGQGDGSPAGMLAAHVVAGALAALLITAVDPMLRCWGVQHGLIPVAPPAMPVELPDRPPPRTITKISATTRFLVVRTPRRGPPVIENI